MNYTFIKCAMVLIASSLIGATLKDVSYSIKQNGIMVNLDYTDAINDDDIIGWKSDRGWVYLTLLGVQAPKNKVADQDFSGDVKKIVIDDFDESRVDSNRKPGAGKSATSAPDLFQPVEIYFDCETYPTAHGKHISPTWRATNAATEANARSRGRSVCWLC